MDELYLPIQEEISKYIHKEATLNLIYDAYLFAREAHKDQFRASGEPYIIHPISVALTLVEYRADPVTIIASLLHDVIEDTSKTFIDIKDKYGLEVARLVEGLTKIQKISYNVDDNGKRTDDQEYASNFQKMLFSMSKDIRVIWIKLSDRLNNMKTLKYLSLEKQLRISKETLDIYAPMAHKLGMYQIKAELEDLSFKYLYPTDYFEISKEIKFTKKSREKDIEKMKENLHQILEEENVDSTISGRIKNIYSTYNKMKTKNISFENIYDLLALRIIVDTVLDCYKVIGIVHSHFTPIPNRFKDYIAMPKPNMYQSLHTAIIHDGKIYEIQIRTHEMDEIAEYGIAAHWAYKEGVRLKKNYYEDTASQLRWYSDLIKYTNENEASKENDLSQTFNEDVLQANVYVFTPKNTVIALPEGGTPLDFAYRIHSRIGETFTGAIVNGKMVPIDYELKTGDVCEIKTSPNAYGPNENWLKIAKASSTRNKIKQFLNKKNRDLLIEQGKELVDEEIKTQHLSLDLTDSLVEENCSERGIKTLEDLYYSVGKGVIGAQAILNDFKEEENRTSNDKIMEYINLRNRHQVFHEDVDIIVEGLSSPSVKLAHCCNPIPGDEIVGYVTKGVGIAVHRTNCLNCKSFDPNRLIDVKWALSSDKRFTAELKLYVNNRDNILADILNACTSNDGKVLKVSARTRKNDVDQGIINLNVQVLSKNNLDIIIANLEKIKGIYSIERIRR